MNMLSYINPDFLSRNPRKVALAMIPVLCLLAFYAPAFAGIERDTGVVFQRLNSPERKAAIEEQARRNQIAQEAFTREQRTLATPLQERNGDTPALSGKISDKGKSGLKSAAESKTSSTAPKKNHSVIRTIREHSPLLETPKEPRSLSSAFFRYGAGFLGLSGLAPGKESTNGRTDEGLGFHQDGTARKANGTTGTSSGPSEDGRRAAAYMGAGLSYDPQRGTDQFRPGYDPFTGQHWRFFDFTPNGGNQAINNASGFGGMAGFSGGEGGFQQMFVDRGLSWASGVANSAGETFLSGLVDGGRARLNFIVDWNGNVTGEGDTLFPFYDGQYTTVFTQIGARSMIVSGGEESGQIRWIGNLGVGQRWFPFAEDEINAGNVMFGYNVFFDNDFTRSHQRGGVGAELQFDWLHLASNYYFPLSDWKRSQDFDGNLVEERPARGWDARLKAYLPFYRNVALTGAYTQWYGDHVGMFDSENLERDPKIWSYGIEYTPVPMLTAFATQRSTELGRNDSEFGLRFNYEFGSPAEDQVKHSKVAERRTVSGSRHEFVDRENRIILEYRNKEGKYQIEQIGAYRFRISTGLDKVVPWHDVRVTAKAAVLTNPPDITVPESSLTYHTKRNGEFDITLADGSGSTPVTIRVGDTEKSFTLNASKMALPEISLNGEVVPKFNGELFATANLQVKLPASVTKSSPLAEASVKWKVIRVQNNSPAIVDEWKTKKTGLTWDSRPEEGSGGYNDTYQRIMNKEIGEGESDITNGVATIQLTDIMGDRKVTVRAEVTVDGNTTQSPEYSLTFGNDGPLAEFVTKPDPAYNPWEKAASYCQEKGKSLPSVKALQRVSINSGAGAAAAAGWTAGMYTDGVQYDPGFWSNEGKGEGYEGKLVVYPFTGDVISYKMYIEDNFHAVCLNN